MWMCACAQPHVPSTTNHDFEAREMKSILRIKQGPKSPDGDTFVTVLGSEVSAVAGFHATSPHSS